MLTADRVVHTTCPYCGVGCRIDLHVKNGLIYRRDGQFDNLEALEEAKSDQENLVDLANRMGAAWHYAGSNGVFDEMASLTPQYAGISHERLQSGGIQWPCPTREHPGTPYLHAGQFTRGRGLLASADYGPPVEETTAEYPLILSTGRILYHWHGSTMSRRSPPGTVLMTFHYAEAAANLLTINAVDPAAKIPEYKVCAVRLAVENGHAAALRDEQRSLDSSI